MCCRNSALTWLLRDTLSGNSKTVVLATLSPAGNCYEESLNTLRYAKRVKTIQMQATVNQTQEQEDVVKYLQ
eukprot:gene19317-6574_t